MTTRRTGIIIATLVFGAALVFGAEFLTGCASGPAQPAAQMTALNPDSPGVRGASKDAAVPLGTTLNTTTGTVTVYGSQPYVHGDYGMEGPGLLYDVQVTVNTDATLPAGTQTQQAMWSLMDADNHVITPAYLYQSNPTLTQFPEGPIFAGDAVRGWVIFKTTLTAAQVTVRYTLTDGHYFWAGA